uniref:Uncharacterized protein n=1 Tax=Aegilops tauschii subsp. strangulata TaxID=200361 RepID=A0A453S958_AEGTS
SRGLTACKLRRNPTCQPEFAQKKKTVNQRRKPRPPSPQKSKQSLARHRL